MRVCLIVGMLWVLAWSAPGAVGRGERPNLVVFVADDLGARDLGCYGSSFYETPQIDRLAREGMRFTRAYAACPVCSPSRASLLTGRWPQRTGITDYIGAWQPEQWTRNTKLLPAPYADRLALGEVTVAEVLRAAGYATFFAGKWHLGPQGHWPEDQGFDINVGGTDRGGPYTGRKYFAPFENPRIEPESPDGEHLPARLARDAVRFIEENRDRPFLVWFSFYDVHTPLMARADLRAKYEAKRARLAVKDRFGTEGPRQVRLSQDHAIYAGMIEAMDAAVGHVVTRLDELGLGERTLVLFTSDNGGLSTSEGSPTSNVPLRAGKGWLYEGGLRVPLVARWPGRIPGGRENATLVAGPDIPPTLLEVSGVRGDGETGRDGRSFWQTLRTGSTLRRGPLYWHYPHYGNQGGGPGAAMVEGPWKLIEWFEDGRRELFRLDRDPGETRDLAAAESRRVESMVRRLRDWQDAVGARATRPNPAYDPGLPDGRR